MLNHRDTDTIEDRDNQVRDIQSRDRVPIIVNGRRKIISSSMLSRDGEISFDEVVRLAFDPPPSGPDIVFTVSYRNGAGRRPDGRLDVGQSVKIQEGTVFNVSFTDKS